MASVSTESSPPAEPGRLPWVVLVIAALAAALHALPLITAALTVPEGWRFTGIHQSSPDLMQYRQWFRQTQLEGPLISDVLTAEPNQPHVLVLLAWFVSTLATWLDASPEFVYAGLGSALAFAFVIVLYRVVEAFVPGPAHRWWIYGALLLGGGLGGHLKLALRFEAVRNLPGVRRMIWDPLLDNLTFEDYRGQFIFSTFFDTHFLLAWLLTTASALALFRYVRRPSTAGLVTTTVLSAFTGLMHLHSGLTFLAIAAGVAWMCWVGQQQAGPALTGLVVAGGGALASVAVQGLLIGRAGIPASPWRAGPILPSILFLAYTLQWAMTAWGLPRLWRKVSLETCVLTGWMIGCLVYAWSGPFYPYPDRGTMTLLIPITILGGLAYFQERSAPTPLALAVGGFFLLATPVWTLAHEVSAATFSPELNSKFVSVDHDRLVQVAKTSAARGDLLLADERSLLWLAPDYPGVHYCAHFFLTVDYARKQEDVRRFYAGTASEQATFMRAHGVKFLFVPARETPARFRGVPGLSMIEENGVGALFSFTAS